jgi:ribosomal-protein-alanine N-acetyltransferase
MHLKLNTERLHIRPLTPSDSAFMLRLLNTAGWLQFIGDRQVRSNEDAMAYIQKITTSDNYFYHVFEIKATQELAGLITLIKRPHYTSPDIGFAMLPEFEGRGYAIEASKAYVDACTTKQVFDTLIAIVMPENHKSIRVLKKLGMVYQAETIDNGTLLHVYVKAMHE